MIIGYDMQLLGTFTSMYVDFLLCEEFTALQTAQQTYKTRLHLFGSINCTKFVQLMLRKKELKLFQLVVIF